MRRLKVRRPSPALVISLIALFLALGGTGYALTLPNGSVGVAQLKPRAVTNSRLATLAISTSKLRPNSVVFSKLANNQFTSQKIRNGSLLGEDLAANTVTGAQIDESTLAITKFAQVSATGAIGPQSGGISATSGGPNRVVLDFGSNQAGRPVQATLLGGTPGTGGEITAAVCGGPSSANPGGVVCPGTTNSPNFVAVDTFNSDGTPAPKAFYVSVPQA
jgi:hypothetical protein